MAHQNKETLEDRLVARKAQAHLYEYYLKKFLDGTITHQQKKEIARILGL
jgi:hypothetical protein